MSPTDQLGRALAGSAWAIVTLALFGGACSDNGGDDDRQRSCGDGNCSGDTCESPLRCPTDCGGCQGSQCTPAGTRGSCGQPCSSSCDCLNPAEVCTADYGELDKRCVPTDCLACPTLTGCSFSPDADGLCASVTCG